jgi:ketosteroid isomerase-like protein
VSKAAVLAVERLYEDWTEGGLSAFSELLSADAEWREPPTYPAAVSTRASRP